ncbi:MAG: IS3 family transposase [bacterium]
MRRPSESVANRNAPIIERIRQLKSDHPFWGYRRVWAHLRYVDGMIVNKKRVYRLMKEHNLIVTKNTRLKAKRVYDKKKPRPNRHNSWWGIDMTKVMSENGWVYIVIVLDWYTKKIVGHHAGHRAVTRDWLNALDRGINRQFPCGVRDCMLHLMSDNGSQPTSTTFMKVCCHLGVRQAFTSYNNPKGNADTERMMRTLKEELLWLREWSGESQIKFALDRWIEKYNESYLHSAHGYKPPNRVELEYKLEHKQTTCSQNTLLVSA